MLPHEMRDGRRRHAIGEPVRAEDNRAVVVDRRLDDFDEPFIVFVAADAAHVAEHLVAPRMPHRFDLGELLRVLTFTNGRMIVRDFAEAGG